MHAAETLDNLAQQHFDNVEKNMESLLAMTYDASNVATDEPVRRARAALCRDAYEGIVTSCVCLHHVCTA